MADPNTLDLRSPLLRAQDAAQQAAGQTPGAVDGSGLNRPVLPNNAQGYLDLRQSLLPPASPLTVGQNPVAPDQTRALGQNPMTPDQVRPPLTPDQVRALGRKPPSPPTPSPELAQAFALQREQDARWQQFGPFGMILPSHAPLAAGAPPTPSDPVAPAPVAPAPVAPAASAMSHANAGTPDHWDAHARMSPEERAASLSSLTQEEAERMYALRYGPMPQNAAAQASGSILADAKQDYDLVMNDPRATQTTRLKARAAYDRARYNVINPGSEILREATPLGGP